MEPFKCVVVGDASSNKTQLFYNYTNQDCSNEYCTSFSENYLKSFKKNTQIYQCEFIDTTGQESYQSIRLISYIQADVFILCFSLTDKKSLDNIKNIWHPEITKVSPKAKVILVGTLLNPHEKTVTDDEVNKTKRCIKFNNYIECDLYEMDQVNSVFETAIKSVFKKRKKKFFSVFHKKKKETELEAILDNSFDFQEIVS
ncbi:hypothetical protein M9Y10_024432 [Tritrichomonas musculus]|uniref:Uncharacterized protein n=1 Tax=Tritrichomonas musculus TaxID=1915356 RepID=A0ABR2HBY3_9EUKA